MGNFGWRPGGSLVRVPDVGQRSLVRGDLRVVPGGHDAGRDAPLRLLILCGPNRPTAMCAARRPERQEEVMRMVNSWVTWRTFPTFL